MLDLPDLLVEGVELGQVTLSLIYRKINGGAEFHRDEVVVTVTNTLTADGLGADGDGLPYFDQHKDTGMLCVDHPWQDNQECATAGNHRWDADHEQYWEDCPHCRQYCARACVKMVNEYYGGAISQDRVSYQFRAVFQNGNLGHDEPLPLRAPLAWALNTSS
jgi:hypothetical protein